MMKHCDNRWFIMIPPQCETICLSPSGQSSQMKTDPSDRIHIHCKGVFAYLEENLHLPFALSTNIFAVETLMKTLPKTIFHNLSTSPSHCFFQQ